MHLVERFADWAVAFRERPLSKDVLHHARRAVIDWHAALYPGMVAPPVTLMKKAFAGESESPRLKALIEGSAAHTVEVDDIFRDGIYHPGAPTIAAAAEALELDRKQFAHALATVTTFAAGLQSAFRTDSMSKPLHAGRAAEAGVTAALMAREGVTGSLDVMTGFAAAMGDQPDWEKGLATLGRDFHITRMTFKNHACCGHTFAAIDGALELKKRMQLKPEDIEKIEVATYKAGVEVAGYENPATAAEGRFSLKYVVATALTHGSVRLAAFSPQRLADETTKRVMQKISVSVDAELEAAFPAKRQARVAIQGKNGRAEWLQPTRIGDPDAPLSDRALEEKYFELVAPVIGEAKAREVLQSLWRLQ